MGIIKAYFNDTAGNESNSGDPGEGRVVLVRFLEGVTGAFTTSLKLVLRRLSQPTASSAEPAKIFNRANVTRLT